MSPEGGNLNRVPANSMPEPAYEPDPQTIAELARSFHLPVGASRLDVARAWRDSRTLADEPYGQESGDPEDLLGIGEDPSAMDQWAEDVLRGAVNDN